MRYHYTNVQPEGGFDRKTKYRNPDYFDGQPERDATIVLVAAGYTAIVDAYKKAGIAVSFEDHKEENAEDKQENDIDITADGITEYSEEDAPSVQELLENSAECSIEELKAQYEQRFGKKAGRMNKDTLIAALDEE